MKLPTPPSASSTERSTGDQDSGDRERQAITAAAEEKSSPRTSLERQQTAERDVRSTGQKRTAGEKVLESDLVPTASRTTEASITGETGEDDELKYPKAWPLAILTLGLCLSIFVVALDNTIICALCKLNSSTFYD